MPGFIPDESGFTVGVTGFEPTTSSSRYQLRSLPRDDADFACFPLDRGLHGQLIGSSQFPVVPGGSYRHPYTNRTHVAERRNPHELLLYAVRSRSLDYSSISTGT